MKLLTFAASALTVSLMSMSAQAAPFQNGTFSSGLAGWTLLNSGGDYVTTQVYFNPSELFGSGVLFQTFDTTIGQTYSVSFGFGAYGGPASGYNQQLQVEVRDGSSAFAGTEIIDFNSAALVPDANAGISLSQLGALVTVNDTDATNGFATLLSTFSFTFAALSGSSTLVFTDQTGNAGQFTDSNVDNVHIQAVPEPSAAWLAALGVSFLLCRGNRKRNA